MRFRSLLKGKLDVVFPDVYACTSYFGKSLITIVVKLRPNVGTYVGSHVRTYASTNCTGGVGETIKRKGGVSQACVAKSTSFTLDIHNMVNWQLSKQDSHWPVSHDHIAGSCINSLRWRDLFGSCPLTRYWGLYEPERDAAWNVTGSNLLTKCFTAHAWR